MFQDIVDLQKSKVQEIINKVENKFEVTFKSPTGSGKTRMMADFMNQIISVHRDVVFIVSTLSKGELAKQNYKNFVDLVNDNIYSNLKPHLIQTETTDESRLVIPDNYNVYVLARDLYKDKGRLKQDGVFVDFLERMTNVRYGYGKKIYVIRDECHQATNNLDELKDRYFSKVINFSATPNIKRKQIPDVEMTEAEAQSVNLIKQVKYCDLNDTVEDAINKFKEIKEQYRLYLGIKPCLIIQISNKDKEKEDMEEIKRALDKSPELKWMLIVDKDKDCDTNDILKSKKLPVSKWKDFAKYPNSLIDIIIFKMVITEGWDIPRACMLYQMRATQSKQLDEQVIGRVRRNPKLKEFDSLTKEAQQLATTAYVWGVKDKESPTIREVKLVNTELVSNEIKLRTTKLKSPTKSTNFDIDAVLKSQKLPLTTKSIFDLFNKFENSPPEVKEMGYSYIKNINSLFLFLNNIEEVNKRTKDFALDYLKNLELETDENGNIKEVSLPTISYYIESENKKKIGKWIWKRADEEEQFSFDSQAEKEWVDNLIELISEDAPSGEGRLIKDISDEISGDKKYIFGKNYLPNSEIKYEYYLNGIHSSFPDFIMKDWKNRIHLFETKSLNKSSSISLNMDEYKEKINALRECYKHASRLTGYLFYIPIKENDSWFVYKYDKGIEDKLSYQSFVNSLKI